MHQVQADRSLNLRPARTSQGYIISTKTKSGVDAEQAREEEKRKNKIKQQKLFKSIQHATKELHLSPNKKLLAVFVRISTKIMKHHDQNQVVEERVYLAYTSTALFITEGSQNRNSNMAGT